MPETTDKRNRWKQPKHTSDYEFVAADWVRALETIEQACEGMFDLPADILYLGVHTENVASSNTGNIDE